MSASYVFRAQSVRASVGLVEWSDAGHLMSYGPYKGVSHALLSGKTVA